MDFYLDFMRALEKSPNPEATLRELTETVKSALEHAPARVALAEGAALLTVVHDYQNPKAVQVLPVFRDITESVPSETFYACLSTPYLTAAETSERDSGERQEAWPTSNIH